MPTALLLHGLSAGPAAWWRLRSWLADAGWTVRTAELLGHGGRGPAPRYALADYRDDVLAVENGGWDLVVGHSLGGAAATLAASADPDWAHRLVLLDPAWRIPDERIAAVRSDQLAELSFTRETIAADHPDWDERDVDAKASAVAQVERDAVARTFDDTVADGGWDMLTEASTLAVPTLVLGGDPSVFALLDPADAGAVARRNPVVTYRAVDGAGHSPHRDRPETTRALILGWLDAARAPA